MSALPKRYFTAEEYLLLEERSPYKSQYIDGQIYPMGEDTSSQPSMMGGAAPDHVFIATNISGGLHSRFRGRPCRVYTSDLRVAVEPGSNYSYPDVVALCGEPRYETARTPPSLLNPQVIFEVLSPSTEGFDRGDKFVSYQRLDSLTDYVLVTVDRMRVEHYTRQPKQAWNYRVLVQPDDLLRLASVDCEIPLAEIYEKVDFPPRPYSEISRA